MASPSLHVAIAGAGIAGLVAARALERLGHRATLVDPRADLTRGGAGLVLWPQAWKTLVELGVEGAENLGSPLRETIMRDAKNRTLLRIPLGLRRSALPRAMRREDLMKALVEGVAGRVRPRACRRVSETPGVCFDLDDGERVVADAAIIASGMGSTLRRAVSPHSAPRACQRASWRGLARFEDADLAGGTGIETLGRGCRMGMFPAGRGWVYWFVQANESVVGQRREGSPLEWLSETLGGWPDPIGGVLAATEPEAVVETAITEMLPQPIWHHGDLLLLGDAAHGMAPDLGRGACTAIENAAAFSRSLARHQTFAGAAAAFARSRRWRAFLLQHASRFAGTMRQLEHPTAYWLRNTVWRWLPPLAALRFAAPVLTRHLMGAS